MNWPAHICFECGKRFDSQNPAIKDGKVVCWDCSDFTIMDRHKDPTPLFDAGWSALK